MPNQDRRTPIKEVGRRGNEIYDRKIRAEVEAGNKGKVVAIDIHSEAYVVAENAMNACPLLYASHTDAEIFCVRIGYPSLRTFGFAAISESP
jgi:hypothetical protein